MKTEIQQTGQYDAWTIGTATCNGVEYSFQVKHYDDPSQFGIKGGRIRKLWLVPKGGDFRHTILNYDRGWERGYSLKGKGAAVKAVFNALVERFN